MELGAVINDLPFVEKKNTSTEKKCKAFSVRVTAWKQKFISKRATNDGFKTQSNFFINHYDVFFLRKEFCDS